MLGLGGTFKALSAVAFFFAWKFYKLPCKAQTEGVGRQDSSPSDVASQITLVDGNDIDKEIKNTIKVISFGPKNFPPQTYSQLWLLIY